MNLRSEALRVNPCPTGAAMDGDAAIDIVLKATAAPAAAATSRRALRTGSRPCARARAYGPRAHPGAVRHHCHPSVQPDRTDGFTTRRSTLSTLRGTPC